MVAAGKVRLRKWNYLGRKYKDRCNKPPQKAPEIVFAELFSTAMFLSPFATCVYSSLWLSYSGKIPL